MSSTGAAVKQKQLPKALWDNYYGIKCKVAEQYRIVDIQILSPTLAVASPSFAERFWQMGEGDLELVMDDVKALCREMPKGEDSKTDLKILKWTGSPMKYTVGTSNKPVSRADKERKQRLGLDKSDRMADLKTEVRRLLTQATKLQTMSEGQYAEFVDRRRKLTLAHQAMLDELTQVEADLELVQFACDEAGERE